MSKTIKKAAAVFFGMCMLLQVFAYAEEESITPSEKPETAILLKRGETTEETTEVIDIYMNGYSPLPIYFDKTSGKTAYYAHSKQPAALCVDPQTPTLLHRIMARRGASYTAQYVTITDLISDFENSSLKISLASGDNYKEILTNDAGQKIIKIGLSHSIQDGTNGSRPTEVLYVDLNKYGDLSELGNNLKQFYEFEIPIKDFLESTDFAALNESAETSLAVEDINGVTIALGYPESIRNDRKIIYFNDLKFVYTPKPAGSVSYTSESDSVSLTWEASESNNCSYNIFRDNVFIANTSETSYKDEGLYPGSEYTYAVQAAAGNAASASQYIMTETKGFFEDPALLGTTFGDIMVNGQSISKETVLTDGETKITGHLSAVDYSGDAVVAAVYFKDGVMKDIAIEEIPALTDGENPFELTLTTESDGEVQLFALDSLSSLKLISQAAVLSGDGFFEKKISAAENAASDVTAEFESATSNFYVKNSSEGAAVVLAVPKDTDLSAVTEDTAADMIVYLGFSEKSVTEENPVKIIFNDEVFDDGTYSFYMSTAGHSADSVPQTEEYASSATIAKIYENLNKTGVTASEVSECIKTPILKLDLTDYNRVSENDVLNLFIKIKPSPVNGVEDISDTLDKAVGTVLFCSAVQKSDADIIKYGESVGLDAEMMKSLLAEEESSEHKKYTYELLSKKKASEISNENAQSIFREAYICALASDSGNTWKALSDICAKYSLVDFSLLGGNATESEVFKKMLKIQYETYDEIDAKYRSVVSSLKQQTYYSGGGGSSTSSGSKSSSSGRTSAPVVSVQSETPDKTATEQSAEIFSDINASHWAYESVYKLLEKNIISSDSVFRPSDNVKREEFVKMLVMIFEPVTDKYCEFSDVVPEEWYYPYVNAAFSGGIVNGISDTHFGIGENVSRQDMAVMIYRALKAEGRTVIPDAEELSASAVFGDADKIADYAKEAVSYLNSVNVINGDDNGNVCPVNPATRAECAKMFCNLLELSERVN